MKTNWIVAGLVCALIGGCHSLELRSIWTKGDNLTDGKNSEWTGLLTTLDDHRTSVGTMNDDQFVYVGLLTTNQDLQHQILRRGLRVWFDHEGGNNRKFGLRYPAPVHDTFRRDEQQAATSAEVNAGWRTASGLDSPTELELYTAGEENPERMTFAQAGGIEARLGFSGDTLIYEMKVPLRETPAHPFAIGSDPGTKVGIGAETVTQHRGSTPQGDSPAGGGGGTHGGGGGGGGYGGRGGHRGNHPEAEPSHDGQGSGQGQPFEQWAVVELATPGSAHP